MSAAQPSAMLHTAEVVHWVALGVMAVVYTLRVRWLLSHRATRDRQAPGNEARTDARRGARYSLLNVGMPWAMESTRRNIFFYVTFVLFHLAVATGIAVAFASTLVAPALRVPAVSAAIFALLGAGLLTACYRLARRASRPFLRLVSSPDDWFSLAMLTVWFAVGLGAQAQIAGLVAGDGVLAGYLYLTSFFLLYVPFSKISHYLYYPFTRIWLGRTLGHRGTFPLVRA
jgi:nitrate reductase gamma subunit